MKNGSHYNLYHHRKEAAESGATARLDVGREALALGVATKVGKGVRLRLVGSGELDEGPRVGERVGERRMGSEATGRRIASPCGPSPIVRMQIWTASVDGGVEGMFPKFWYRCSLVQTQPLVPAHRRSAARWRSREAMPRVGARPDAGDCAVATYAPAA